MYINTNEVLGFIAIFIGVCLGIAVLVLLIIMLVNLTRTVRKVNRIIDENAESISKTIEKLPALADNADKAVVSIKDNVNVVGGVITNVEDTFFDTRPKASNEMMMTIVNIAENVAKVIINLVTNKK